MKIEKISKKNSNMYQILLSDNTSLSFYDDTIIYYNLLANKEFSEAKLKEMLTYNSNVAAYYKALSYIKAKLRTKREVTAKLRSLGYSDTVINSVITKLTNQNYLNDDLYLKCYLTDQVNLTLKGPNKITNELVKLGFNIEDINEKLSCYEKEIWQEKVDKIIAKKIKSNHNLSKAMLQNKLRQDLKNMGYAKDLIDNSIAKMDYKDDDSIIKKEVAKAYKKYSTKYSGSELNFRIKHYLYTKGFSNDISLSDYL